MAKKGDVLNEIEKRLAELSDESQQSALDIAINRLPGLNWDGRKLKKAKGLVVHHTGGRGTPEDVVNILNDRGFGAHFVMDRDGKVFQIAPDGARVSHMKPSDKGLSNSNTLGIEVIAKDSSDMTPAQIESGKKFIAAMRARNPDIGENVFGHGELNKHKMADEGLPIVNAWREDKGLQTTEIKASNEGPGLRALVDSTARSQLPSRKKADKQTETQAEQFLKDTETAVMNTAVKALQNTAETSTQTNKGEDFFSLLAKDLSAPPAENADTESDGPMNVFSENGGPGSEFLGNDGPGAIFGQVLTGLGVVLGGLGEEEGTSAPDTSWISRELSRAPRRAPSVQEIRGSIR